MPMRSRISSVNRGQKEQDDRRQIDFTIALRTIVSKAVVVAGTHKYVDSSENSAVRALFPNRTITSIIGSQSFYL
jgi:hypothetical protein